MPKQIKDSEFTGTWPWRFAWFGWVSWVGRVGAGGVNYVWVAGLVRLSSREHWSEKSSVWDISHATLVRRRTLSWQERAGCLIGIGQKHLHLWWWLVQLRYSLVCLSTNAIWKHLCCHSLSNTRCSNVDRQHVSTIPFWLRELIKPDESIWRGQRACCVLPSLVFECRMYAASAKELWRDGFCPALDLSGQIIGSLFNAINFSAVRWSLSPLSKIL